MNKLLAHSILIAGLATPLSAGAVNLLTLGDGSFGELAMSPNDDGSSNMLLLPFAVNFYGNGYETFYVNNNGNITFAEPFEEYTPDPFPIAYQSMIAPYWADVDTRCETCGNVYVATPNADTVMVTWNDVGYYDQHADKTNNFQLVLRNQLDGNFDVEFRYDRLEWTTGDASDGIGGLGGTPAQAGFDAGDGTNYFALPGSFTDSILDIANQTNVDGGAPGFWSFSIRDGDTPGSTPDNPLLPVVVDDSFVFEFNVQPDETIFIDPEVAIGYDYEVLSGPDIASILLPTGIGDDLYSLFLWDDTLSDYIFLSEVTGGIPYLFTVEGGVRMFRVLGIETDANLDPANPLAFVTGLTFADSGTVSMTQTPIVSQVPLPAASIFMLSGLLGLGTLNRKKYR